MKEKTSGKLSRRGSVEIAMDGGTNEEYLYRTKAGRFWLRRTVCFVDGRELGNLEPIPREVDDAPVEVRQKRLTCKESIVHMTTREAMIWCIKTQIPETLRGYLLDCV